jgi:hypothetical protein
MITRAKVVFAIVTSGLAFAAANPAHALTMQECSAKYKAAQTAGTLNGQKWNDFRKEQCGSDTAAAPDAAPATPAAATTAEAKPGAAAQTPAATTAPAGAAVFPAAIDPKYSKESAGKARRLTCAAQWKANKTTNATGGLKWIQKGGGYWSECNKKLKGSA